MRGWGGTGGWAAGGRESGGAGGWRRVRGGAWGPPAGSAGRLAAPDPRPTHLGERAQPLEQPQGRTPIFQQALCRGGVGAIPIKLKQLAHVEGRLALEGSGQGVGLSQRPEEGAVQLHALIHRVISGCGGPPQSSWSPPP